MPTWLRPFSIISLIAAVAVTVVALVAASGPAPGRVVGSALDGLGVFLIANVAAFALGVQSTAAAFRVVSQSTGGPFGERVFFPLASSAAAPPAAAALFLVGAILLGSRGGRRRRPLRLTGSVSALVVAAAGAN